MIWQGAAYLHVKFSEISSHVILKEEPSVKQGGMNDEDDNDDNVDDDIHDHDHHINYADKL